MNRPSRRRDDSKIKNILSILAQITILITAIWAVLTVAGDSRYSTKLEVESKFEKLEKKIDNNHKEIIEYLLGKKG